MSSLDLADANNLSWIRGGTTFFWVMKRLLDLLFAGLLLPVFLAIVVTLFFLNPFYNPGKLFFVQQRVGFKGRTFPMLKFRSMSHADADHPETFATNDRHRITPLGSFLREKRIDEIPQVLNILAGHMSLIGPRPEQIQFAEKFSQIISEYNLRHSVRPGISGLAQVEIGYADCDEKTRKKVELDLKYIKQAGWRLELQIIKKTPMVVVSGFGAV